MMTRTPLVAVVMATLGVACVPGQQHTIGTATNASKVQLFNCNQVSDTGQSRAYNIFARKDGGTWISYGGLNSQPGWTGTDEECLQDSAHLAAAITVDLFSTQGSGKWEICAIKLPNLPNEPDCNSAEPSPAPARGRLATT